MGSLGRLSDAMMTVLYEEDSLEEGEEVIIKVLDDTIQTYKDEEDYGTS